MQTRTVVWRQYRDESKRSLPQKLIDLVPAFQKKTGQIPTYIGLPRSMITTENKITELGIKFAVRTVVPDWAPCEIWLGMEVDRASV